MIVTPNENHVKTQGIQLTKEMGINKAGMGFIQNILRSQIYSDRITSLIREGSLNSIDSHIEAGKGDVPIEITLPSRFNPVFKVSDSGTGMSEDTILNLYCYFGASSKRESNAVSGFMGIGKVAMLSYTDSFTLTSRYQGQKSTYNVYVDSNNLTQVARLCQESTTELDGVELSMAVKDCDINAFHTKAKDLFKYFKTKPVVHGADFKFEARTPIMSGTDWRVFGGGESVAIMGQIGYKIDYDFGDQAIRDTLASGIEIDFAIGDLNVAASREGLSYDPRTQKTIKDKLARIVTEVAVELNKRFLNCATLFDAHKMYGSVFNMGNNLYALRNMVRSSLKFNNKPITSNAINFNEPTDGSFSLRQYEKSWRGNKIKSYTYRSIDCTDQTILVDNDLSIVSGINNRVYTDVQNGKEVYVLNYRTPADKQKFLTETGLVDSNFIKLSSLPKISLASAPGTGAKNTKHQTKEFSYDMAYAKQKGVNSWSRRNANSAYWTSEKVDIQNDSGVYVILQSFEFKDKNGFFQTPYRLKEIIDSISTFITIPKVYGFKIAVEDEAKKNQKMVDLWSYIATELTAYFIKNKIAQKVSNRSEFEQNNKVNWYGWLKSHYKEVKPTTAFYKAGVIFDYMNPVTDKKVLDESVKHSGYFTSSMQPEHDLEKLVKEIENTYPLFDCIEWYQAREKKEAIITYINMIG
jgi:hypothetical protein